MILFFFGSVRYNIFLVNSIFKLVYESFSRKVRMRFFVGFECRVVSRVVDVLIFCSENFVYW